MPPRKEQEGTVFPEYHHSISGSVVWIHVQKFSLASKQVELPSKSERRKWQTWHKVFNAWLSDSNVDFPAFCREMVAVGNAYDKARLTQKFFLSLSLYVQ